MINLLNRCNGIYTQEVCCHNDPLRACFCMTCLQNGFYGAPDWYTCLKKLSMYVMNYGPCYASEMYHFLHADLLLQNNFLNRNVRVLSLGCGFSPDLFGLMRYIQDNQLPVTIDYTGVDSEPLWGVIRQGVVNGTFHVADLLNGFTVIGYDIIILNKLFSTLKSLGIHLNFLQLFVEQIKINMLPGSILIYNDINHQDNGRDIFDFGVNHLFRNTRKYKFNIDSPYGRQFTNINEINNIFAFPQQIATIPKPTVIKSVVFVYQR